MPTKSGETRVSKSRNVAGQGVLFGMTALEPNRKKRAEPEYQMQCELFQHLDEWEVDYPILHFIHAIPNGLALAPRTAVKAKKQGVRAGIHDIFAPIKRGDVPGLYVEMKAGKNKMTPEQEAFARHLDGQGYQRAVCYSWTDAARIIVDYVGIRDEWIEQQIRINTKVVPAVVTRPKRSATIHPM